MLLKAFLMSGLTKRRLGGEAAPSMNCLAAWAAASHPLLTPTPSCTGLSSWLSSWTVDLAATLAASLRRRLLLCFRILFLKRSNQLR